jgi:hypothetical protein
MDLKGQSVLLHLTDEGRRILRQAGWDSSDTPPVPFEVHETTNEGLWVELVAAGHQYVVMIRWEFISTVVIDTGEIKKEDLVN